LELPVNFGFVVESICLETAGAGVPSLIFLPTARKVLRWTVRLGRSDVDQYFGGGTPPGPGVTYNATYGCAVDR
jgi:hypothetical protein